MRIPCDRPLLRYPVKLVAAGSNAGRSWGTVPQGKSKTPASLVSMSNGAVEEQALVRADAAGGTIQLALEPWPQVGSLGVLEGSGVATAVKVQHDGHAGLPCGSLHPSDTTSQNAHVQSPCRQRPGCVVGVTPAGPDGTLSVSLNRF
jgi:hypothetical protein